MFVFLLRIKIIFAKNKLGKQKDEKKYRNYEGADVISIVQSSVQLI